MYYKCLLRLLGDLLPASSIRINVVKYKGTLLFIQSNVKDDVV